ncbi:SDR family oxidoreductase [Tessaracoccus sp. MC1865]|uniref:SDR family oxidoreductase n=1 Tax=Tessaracoccus sp. MC1865 TaxID=2760310 RepID=UPI0015FF7A30|nr:SDR family NAD(P)-dependent oxidoreductase [Tessaracoccus sp. MC1865]MBB1482608.1 SDR family oxidoreductase [Tessaracoccus sp. MC1865]QTO37940.1 SDR family oxidoreductase [Tessaracoccus sp. MC1865]
MTAKHVVVTGAAGGIGRWMVRDLVDEGFAVTAMDMSGERLDELASEFPSVSRVACDVTDSDQVADAVDRAVADRGEIFGLVNLAGTNKLQPLGQITDDDWRFIIDANLTSAFYLCRAVVPHMTAGDARIVNTSSIFGIRGADYDVHYSAAKAGVVGLTRALATELARSNITVNCVAPIVVLTERVKKMPEEHLAIQKARIPLGRFSSEQDVTGTVLFLLGERGAFYTGQTFSPNGGDTMP